MYEEPQYILQYYVYAYIYIHNIEYMTTICSTEYVIQLCTLT